MNQRLSQLAELAGATLLGDCDPMISAATSISRASKDAITFATSVATLEQFRDCDAAAVVTTEALFAQVNQHKPAIVVEQPEATFVKIAEQFKPPVVRSARGISPQANIDPTANIADDVTVYAGATILAGTVVEAGCVIFPGVTVMENCRIGRDTQVLSNVTIYENTQIGQRCLLHAGAVLGAYGFGYKSANGQHQLSAQLGNVVVGDDVEIGANTTIDRGTYDSTTIGDGTKIDNLVMIGHNCQIGRHNLLCSQVGIAGSCTTGDYTVMGGQVGLGDHVDVGSNVSVGAKSGLMQNVPDGQHVFGIPGRPARETMQIMAHQAKLPALRQEVRALTQQVAALQETSRTACAERKAA